MHLPATLRDADAFCNTLSSFKYRNVLFSPQKIFIFLFLPEGQNCNSTMFQSVCEATFYESLITFQMSFQSLAKYNKWNRSRFPVNAPLYGFP